MKKIFLLMLPFALFSCSDNDDNNTPQVVIPTPNTEAITYIRGTMDAQSFDYSYNNSETTPNSYGFGTGYLSNGVTNYYYYGGELAPADLAIDYPSLSIYFDNMFAGDDGEETDAFYTAFQTIPTNYLANEQNDSHIKGIDIEYTDANGKNYSSVDGTQSGSTFTVLTSEQGTEDGTTDKTQTVTGTFSCKLYNDLDPTDIITITNGQYKLILKEYND